jgi:hypothetical protein
MIARGFLGTEGAPKNFFSEFTRVAGNEGGGTMPACAPLARCGHRLGGHSPITPRIIAVQIAP